MMFLSDTSNALRMSFHLLDLSLYAAIPLAFEVNNSSKEIAESIVAELPQRNLLMAKLKLKELVDTRVLNNDECPAILAEIEKVLA